MRPALKSQQGFTLIELSIVLVIIGLIVGGVLVGQDLIRAAAVRAQITQIEQYNTAVNTFYGKYGALPGDIPANSAVQFGLSSSVAARTFLSFIYGDGNGVITGIYNGSGGGESALFWMDLAAAGLIPAPSQICADGSGVYGGDCAQPAKIGMGNGIYVFSNGYQSGSWVSAGSNYFGISASVTSVGGTWTTSNPGLTVAQAYAMDKKLDDGLPQSGNVIAAYLNLSTVNPNGYGGDYGMPVWVNPGGVSVVYWGVTTSAITGSSTTCYDNASGTLAYQQYSISQNGGAGVNCALSFKMQAGD